MKSFAFVFPGQGSQSVGMLQAFSGERVVIDTLAEASEVLQQDLRQLIAQGPEEDLNLTVNTQPVMLTAGIACYRAWLEHGGVLPQWVAGHSLGEYSALVAAQVISFADALPLVRYRAQVMQQAVAVGEGAMAAILGLDDDAVRALCVDAAHNQIVEAVNFNAPAQVVIAGTKGAVQRACDLAKTRGAKRAVILPVSAPFHSSLMQNAAEQLAAYLADIPFAAPRIALINNVDVAIQEDPLAIKQALVRQAWQPVRWVEVVRKMAAQGTRHVIECGPGKVLAGLNKRIDANLVAGAIFDPQTLQETLQTLELVQ